MRLHPRGLAAATFVVMLGLAQSAFGATIANLDEACGGPDKITCNSALYCHLPDGQCSAPDAVGTCVKAPDFCMRVSRPVCGCNGKTYANDCERQRAKVQLDHVGACPKEPNATPPKPRKKKHG